MKQVADAIYLIDYLVLVKKAKEPSIDDQPSENQPSEEPSGDQSGIDQIDRRGFLRTVGSTAAAASGITTNIGALLDVGSAVTGGTSGLFDNLSDEELLQTPEEKWLGQIDPRRAAHIAKKYPAHSMAEAAHKVYKIMAYGIGGLVSPQALKSQTAARAALRAISAN